MAFRAGHAAGKKRPGQGPPSLTVQNVETPPTPAFAEGRRDIRFPPQTDIGVVSAFDPLRTLDQPDQCSAKPHKKLMTSTADYARRASI